MQKQLNKLADIVRSLGELWGNPMYTTASVLIQNMAAQVTMFTRDEFDKYLNILKEMAEFDPYNHVLQWAYKEPAMLISGYLQEKDYQEYYSNLMKEEEDTPVEYVVSKGKTVAELFSFLRPDSGYTKDVRGEPAEELPF